MKALIGCSVVAAALLLVPSAHGAVEGPRRLDAELEPHGIIRWERGKTPALLVRTRRGDGWITLAQRWSGTSHTAKAINDANPGLAQPLRDRRVRIPVEVLRGDVRLQAASRLFPADRRVSLGYQHWVLDPFSEGEESWEWLAELFTGRRSHADSLRRANPELAEEGLDFGRPVLIPEARLLAVFRRLEPVVTPTPTARPRPTVAAEPTQEVVAPPATAVVQRSTPGLVSRPSRGALSYDEDQDGSYAVYRLRRGEALYSAVVVRFTGQLHAKQVNATAQQIARRSGITDVTAIPVNYPIKIPLELLLPEHLPQDDPRRLAWLAEQKELARFLEVVHAADLSGVHVVIDAGHGGKDTGAVVGGLWESTYAYDIACRIKENLERHTRATVSMIRHDLRFGTTVPAQSRLEQHRQQVLLTTPRYALTDSTTGVHLRWYLGNDIVLKAGKKGVPRSKMVFLSVHSDSLHSSVRGAMVYVPSRYLRQDSYTAKRRGLSSYSEYRNHPTVKLDSKFKARAEASSRHLAEGILGSLRRNDVAVHPYEPIRDRILRGRRTWVPAVLRYSLAQNAVLVECCNMANDEDRKLLLDRAWRELFARSVVEGMAAAFDS